MKENQKTEVYDRIPIIHKERLAFVDRLLEEERQQSLKKESTRRIVLLDKKNDRVFRYDLMDTCIIGRRAELCDIVLDYDRTVSSRQCRLYVSEGMILLADMGGTNRTYLNHQLLKEPAIVQDGDTIGFGRVDLIIRIYD